MQVDPNCPVVIDSLQSERCSVASVLPPTDQSAVPTADPSSNPATDSPTDVTVIVIVIAVVGVVLLVMVTAIVVIVLAVIIFAESSQNTGMCQFASPTCHTLVAGLHLKYVYHGGTNYL